MGRTNATGRPLGRGFTSVRPIGLSLAWCSGESESLDITAPASHPAVTSDALGVGNRLEHWPEAVLPAYSLDATSCRTSINPLCGAEYSGGRADHALYLAILPPVIGGHVRQVAPQLACRLRSSGLRCQDVHFFLADGEAAMEAIFLPFA